MNDTTAVSHGMKSPSSQLHDSQPQTSQLQEALQARSNILMLTQQAEDAVLKPDDAGSWSHALRAALAARIAQQNALPELALHYASMIGDEHFKPLAEPHNDGREHSLEHVIHFMDSVALSPRDVIASDVASLQSQGVSDADIVRLTELNAFMAYQVRLIAGLELMSGTAS